MQNNIKTRWRLIIFILAAGMGSLLGCQFEVAQATSDEMNGQAASSAQEPSALLIENDTDLPDTYPQAVYELQFRARGGVPTFHWRLEKGALPPGLKLEDTGLLHGRPERTGEFEFTLSVTDGSHRAVQKSFILRVKSALTLNWKDFAHVNGSRIEGSVEVTNTTPDDMDLSFIVLAVAGNGRATAIGYQHFILRRGTIAKELPFGESLPNGGYVVHVDAVGEVAPHKLIYRDRMQTPSALQVTVGP